MSWDEDSGKQYVADATVLLTMLMNGMDGSEAIVELQKLDVNLISVLRGLTIVSTMMITAYAAKVSAEPLDVLQVLTTGIQNL